MKTPLVCHECLGVGKVTVHKQAGTGDPDEGNVIAWCNACNGTGVDWSRISLAIWVDLGTEIKELIRVQLKN